jgi:hypothetical protein
MKKSLIAVLIVPLLFAGAFSADFLNSARGGGLGFSFFVLGDDPSGALYNPASLGFINGWQSQFMYNKQNDYGYLAASENPYQGLIGFVYNQPEWGTFSLNTLQSGSMGDGSSIPTVNYIAFSYGREFWSGLAMGTSLKYLDEYGYFERSAFDVDFGITYRTAANIILAASAENIARSKLTPAAAGFAEKLPRRVRAGGAYIQEMNQTQAAFLLGSQIQESGFLQDQTTFLVNAGTEWWFNRFGKMAFATRLGYTFGKGELYDIKSDYSGISGGVSVNYNLGSSSIRIDYSLETFPYETADGSNPINHYMALNFGWGGVPDYSRFEQEESFTQNPPAEPYRLDPPQEKSYEPAPEQVEKIDSDTEFDLSKFERYDVEMDVSDVSTLDAKRLVFYLRPQTLISTNSWKLYIFKAKIKKWDQAEINRWALKVVEGKGVPPINVIWDGISNDGKMLPPGGYYYILTAVDSLGRNFATKWNSFVID